MPVSISEEAPYQKSHDQNYAVFSELVRLGLVGLWKQEVGGRDNQAVQETYADCN